MPGSLAVREMLQVIELAGFDFVEDDLPFLAKRLDGGFRGGQGHCFTATDALIHEFDLQAVAANSYASLPCIHALTA